MWQFIMGVFTGVYIGTYYDCKPSIEFVKDTCKKNFPKEKP